MKYGFLAFILAGLLLAACGGKGKKNVSDSDEITIEDFIDFYPEIKLPFNYSDTSFPQKENDSLAIAQDVFLKFSPDSSVPMVFNATAKPKYYPVGKFNNGEEEVYLLTRGVSKDKKVLLLSAYNKKKKFIAQLPVIRIEKNTTSAVSVTIDPKFNISKTIRKKMQDGSIVQGHDVYILNNSSKKFMLVMTDSLGEATGELINPIDTLPRLMKYSGDYGDGKNNLISFRDGQREGRLHMFVHLNNENKGCGGELKGEINFTGPTTAEYRQGGDPCVLSFTFSNSGVTVKEVEGCGSRLGTLECSFDGNYTKRKAPKIAAETQGKTALKK